LKAGGSDKIETDKKKKKTAAKQRTRLPKTHEYVERAQGPDEKAQKRKARTVRVNLTAARFYYRAKKGPYKRAC
jgi:hypothetical protein